MDQLEIQGWNVGEFDGRTPVKIAKRSYISHQEWVRRHKAEGWWWYREEEGNDRKCDWFCSCESFAGEKYLRETPCV